MTYGVTLPERGTFEAWRAAARLAMSHRIAPDDIGFAGSTGLFAATPLPAELGQHQILVPAAFV
ncbi:MAG: uracil-DNA glycosylase, partial [Paracoccaceae bacterium]